MQDEVEAHLIDTIHGEHENEQICRDEENLVPLEMKYSRKKALLDFRCKVEDALLNNTIFREDKKGNDNLRELTLWNVPLLPSKGHEVTDIVLMKFLKAKDFKVSAAFNLLQKTLEWRREININKILDENLDSELENVGFVCSKDKQVHPLCYIVDSTFKNKDLYSNHEKREECLRWNIQFMEKCVQTLHFKPGGANSIIRIVDLKYAPDNAMKELRFFFKKISTLFQENYPGIIVKNVFINVPLWILAFHAVQLRLLTQGSKNKFIFVRPYRVTNTLLKYIAPENLPVQYGGLKRQNNNDEFSCHDKVMRIKVRANSLEIIQIPIDQPGVTLFWDMTVVGYEVNYKEEFIPDDDCSYRILLQKDEKMRTSVRNSFYIREPGKIVLSIENDTFKTKVGFYRYSIKPTVTNFSTRF